MSQRDVPEPPVSASRSGARADRLACWMIRRAAHRAPASLASRLEEEWLADLAARRSTAARLRFAVGCAWATRVILHELGGVPATVGAGLAGEVAVPPAEELFSRRAVTFLLVMGVHVAALYGLMTLGMKIFTPKPILPSQVRVIDQVRPPLRIETPPPNVPPQVIDVRIPEWPPVDETVKSDLTVDDFAQHTGPETLSKPQSPPAVRLLGGPGAGFPDTDDYYPSASKRAEEEGVVQVGVCVGPDGRLSADPSLTHSSGFKRLDEGALRLARAGSGHYRPSTEDGRPVAACYDYKIRFKLKTGF